MKTKIAMITCNSFAKNIVLQKTEWRMPKDIKKLFEDIDTYRTEHKIKNMTLFAQKVNEWLPVAFLPVSKHAWSSWKIGKNEMGDATYCCLQLFLKEHLKQD